MENNFIKHVEKRILKCSLAKWSCLCLSILGMWHVTLYAQIIKNPPLPPGTYMEPVNRDSPFPISNEEGLLGPADAEHSEVGYIEFPGNGSCNPNTQQFRVEVSDGANGTFRWSVVWNCQTFEGTIPTNMKDPDIAIQRMWDKNSNAYQVFVLIVGLPKCPPISDPDLSDFSDFLTNVFGCQPNKARDRIGMQLYKWQAPTGLLTGGFTGEAYNTKVLGNGNYFNFYGLAYPPLFCPSLLNNLIDLPGDISCGRVCRKPKLDVNDAGQVALVWEEVETILVKNYIDFPFDDYMTDLRYKSQIYLAQGYINGSSIDTPDIINPTSDNKKIGGVCGRPNFAIRYPFCEQCQESSDCNPCSTETYISCISPKPPVSEINFIFDHSYEDNTYSTGIYDQIDGGRYKISLEGCARSYGDLATMECGDDPDYTQFYGPEVSISNIKKMLEDGNPKDILNPPPLHGIRILDCSTFPETSDNQYFNPCLPCLASQIYEPMRDSTIITVLYSRSAYPERLKDHGIPGGGITNGYYANQFVWGRFCGNYIHYLAVRNPDLSFNSIYSDFKGIVKLQREAIPGYPGNDVRIAARTKTRKFPTQDLLSDQYIHHYTLVTSGGGMGCNELGYYIDSPVSVFLRRDIAIGNSGGPTWMPINGKAAHAGWVKIDPPVFPPQPDPNIRPKAEPYPLRRVAFASQARISHYPEAMDNGQFVVAWHESGISGSRIVAKAFDNSVSPDNIPIVPYGVVNSAEETNDLVAIAGRSGNGRTLISWLVKQKKRATSPEELIEWESAEFRYKVNSQVPGVNPIAHDCNAK